MNAAIQRTGTLEHIGYVRPHHGQQSREVITLSATGQLGMAAPGRIQLTVVTSLLLAPWWSAVQIGAALPGYPAQLGA